MASDAKASFSSKVEYRAVIRYLYLYSPDLAPGDFFLFPNLKKDIRVLHFRSDEEVVTAVEEWVNGKDPDFFSSGLMALEHRWSKCITLEGNYIEKEEVDFNRK